MGKVDQQAPLLVWMAMPKGTKNSSLSDSSSSSRSSRAKKKEKKKAKKAEKKKKEMAKIESKARIIEQKEKGQRRRQLMNACAQNPFDVPAAPIPPPPQGCTRVDFGFLDKHLGLD